MWRHSRPPSGQPVRRVVVGSNRVAANVGRSDQPDNEHRCRWTAATRCAPHVEPVFFPLDEELELLPGELSLTLAEGVARLGTRMPFEHAATGLAYFWGVELEETTMRRYTQAAGTAYVAPSKPPKSSDWSANDQRRQPDPRSRTPTPTVP